MQDDLAALGAVPILHVEQAEVDVEPGGAIWFEAQLEQELEPEPEWRGGRQEVDL